MTKKLQHITILGFIIDHQLGSFLLTLAFLIWTASMKTMVLHLLIGMTLLVLHTVQSNLLYKETKIFKYLAKILEIYKSSIVLVSLNENRFV